LVVANNSENSGLQIHSRQKFGRWRTARPIARGGNGQVWLAEDESGKQVAIKFLAKNRPVAYARFRDEVAVLQKVTGVPGILPILQANLPSTLEAARPWYAMPLGIPIDDWARRVTPRERVEAIAAAANTMAALHERQIAHRDIKPGNLVMFDRRCHVVDFGLVHYPEKTALTGYKEHIGPLWTMAPEVRRNGRNADPFPADVFSLAKTLWILLTQVNQGFDGQYVAGSEFSIRSLFPDSFVTPLEDLLNAATAHNPAERPTMGEYEEKLRSWLQTSDDFLRTNPLQWEEALSRLFPVAAPTRAIWTDPALIIAILNAVGQTNLNHLFFPDSGGMDLEGARLSVHEPGCIELHTDFWNIVKPLSLTLETFPGDAQWNYLRLETASLDPAEVCDRRLDDDDDDQEEEDEQNDQYTSGERASEELTEIDEHTYASRACWDENRYDGGELPDSARVIIRWFGGAFVIFQKTSFYNLAHGKLDAYNGRHNRMDAEQFRSHIEELRNAVEERGIDLRASRIQERDMVPRL
jgi:serine/threonine protein kinase